MRSLFAVALVLPLASYTRAGPDTRDVEVVALDYAFQLPAQLPAGRTTFHFVNKGKQRHELNIVLLKRGATLQQYIAAANAEQPVGPMTEATVGVLFAGPDSSSPSQLLTDLLPDRDYAVRCILRDTVTAPRHQALGMFSSIHVNAVPAHAMTRMHGDTIVGMDYAFRAPATLRPGRHYLAFVNEGKQRHEVYMAALKPGVTVRQVVEAEQAGANARALIESPLGVLHSPAGTSPIAMLEVDLLPGREYLIRCNFMDDPKAPRHIMLGMFGSIKISGQAQ